MKKIKEWFKDSFRYIKEQINWIKNKELIEEEIRIDTHKIDLQQIEIEKLKNKIKKLENKKWLDLY